MSELAGAVKRKQDSLRSVLITSGPTAVKAAADFGPSADELLHMRAGLRKCSNPAASTPSSASPAAAHLALCAQPSASPEWSNSPTVYGLNQAMGQAVQREAHPSGLGALVTVSEAMVMPTVRPAEVLQTVQPQPLPSAAITAGPIQGTLHSLPQPSPLPAPSPLHQTTPHAAVQATHIAHQTTAEPTPTASSLLTPPPMFDASSASTGQAPCQLAPLRVHATPQSTAPDMAAAQTQSTLHLAPAADAQVPLPFAPAAVVPRSSPRSASAPAHAAPHSASAPALQALRVFNNAEVHTSNHLAGCISAPSSTPNMRSSSVPSRTSRSTTPEATRQEVLALRLETARLRAALSALQEVYPEVNDPELLERPVAFVNRLRERHNQTAALQHGAGIGKGLMFDRLNARVSPGYHEAGQQMLTPFSNPTFGLTPCRHEQCTPMAVCIRVRALVGRLARIVRAKRPLS
jgi:hypothetical protein